MGCCASAPAIQAPKYAFLDVSVSGEGAGRLYLELRPDLVPRTVRNFEQLCEGFPSNSGGRGYAGTKFHRIVPDLCIQGGECGPSIYGKTFRDENFKLKHMGRGTLYMANLDEPNTNASQFFICLAENFRLDHKFVAFGKVVETGGTFALLDRLESLGTNRGHTSAEVVIDACGMIASIPQLPPRPADEPPAAEAESDPASVGIELTGS